MNVAFYAPLKAPDSPIPSGDRLIARMLMAALEHCGHNVHLASHFRSFDQGGDGERQLKLKEIGEVTAERVIQKYREMPEAEKPQLWVTYHLYHKAPDWLGPRAADELKIPYAIVEASAKRKNSEGAWRLGHEAVVEAIGRADLIVSINPRDEPALRPLLRPTTLHAAARPFIDGAIFQAAAAQRSDSRAAAAERYKLDADVPWLITVAMMRDDVKLQSYRLLASALARLTGQPWRILVVGDGAARPEVEKVFAPLGERAVFTGELERPDVAAVLAASDLFVWPAINEAIGMAFVEAQAAGLPVIGAMREGVASVVADGRTGLLVPEGSVAHFAGAIDALLKDPDRRRTMGAMAGEHARVNHDVRTAGQSFCRALERLIA